MTGDDRLHVACVQMTAGAVLADNMHRAAALIRDAATALPDDAPRLIATPEMTSGIIKGRSAQWAAAHPQDGQPEDAHPAIGFFADLAREVAASLLIGSMAIKPSPDDPDQRLYNRSVLFGPDGVPVARYDKINMFDVTVEGDQAYRESHAYRPGPAVPVVVPLGPSGIFSLGLSICYDVRFPALYRELARAGASVIAVPSAFTVPTGRAHWSVLLRARAIETGAYVIAPAQTGEHYPGRRTYGHSMIISPWGEVLAEADDQPGIITATLDISQVTKARHAIPACQQ